MFHCIPHRYLLPLWYDYQPYKRAEADRHHYTEQDPEDQDDVDTLGWILLLDGCDKGFIGLAIFGLTTVNS